MAEQRAHKRVRVNMKVAYRDNDHVYKMGKVCDLSRGGMYVNTGNTPDCDGFLIASLDAEEFGKVIRVQGQIIWKTHTGMGVAFTQTDEKGLGNLLSYRGAPF
ncbi:MAG TPA: PilZ domain-containing protein [Deltaproteobacteria bacterium]|nr:PilZ domain-containing protein [Deltaproteobacteria bacterium]HPR54825.1 PilZ domain-containing protein [Deltaproteobacteria bacterium]HXK46550.1 PilZ domain-containing protein [Deltaproteobacteria bacterium]